MRNRKKPDQNEVPLNVQEEIGMTRLRFGGQIIELTPTAVYPFPVLQTAEYEDWIEGMVDRKTSTRINSNTDKMQRGLFGDWKEVGEAYLS